MNINKTLLGLVAATCALGVATAASAAGSISQSAPVTATIATAIALTKTSNMAFGTIIKPSNANTNTVVLSPAGAVSITGSGDGAVLAASTHSQAVFSLVAPVGTTYASLTNLSMTPALSNATATATPTTTSGTYGVVPAGGIQDLNVGGQFDITAATTVQAYTGTLNLTVNYN
jgi:hypothetical protein